MKKGWGVIFALFWPGLLLGESTLTPSQQILDRTGAPVRVFLSENHTYYYPVSLGEISPWFVAAAVAAEDQRFYRHSGVDWQAVLRAAWQNAQEGSVLSGASTLTQQLVRNIEPRPKTWWGKLREAYQAGQWEKNHTKEEILEEYFNRIEFGNLTQGVQAASQFYFGVDAADVSLAQAAFLVGLIKSPTRYNPLKYKPRALKRRAYVLSRMQEEHFIDGEMYRLSLEEPVELRAAPRPFEALQYTNFLRSLLSSQTGTVRTPLDNGLQRYAQQVVKTHVRKLKDEHVTNAAVIVIENKTGAVLAYVGSADAQDAQAHGQVDGVRALRQPGSSLKPFVYGAAFEKGLLTPADLLADEDTFFDGGFRPRNYDESFHGLVSVRQALACSYNIPAVKAAERVGVAPLLDVLHAAGLSELSREPDFYGLGLSLGNGEVQLLNLANAYAALARGGEYKPLLFSLEPLVQVGGRPRRVFSPQTAYLISHILADNHSRAAAFGLNSALAVPFELAAKTGTSKDYKDNFTLAYTPRWTIGVWVGNFDASPMRKVSGVTGAGPIMHDLAVYLQQKYPSAPFEKPDGVITKSVCNVSGKLAGTQCIHTHEEVFLKNQLPSVCNGKHTAAPSPVTIVSPAQGDIYQWDPAVAGGLQKLLWQAVCHADKCAWILNGQKQPSQSCRIEWPLTVGKHRLEVSCDGANASISFEVLP